MTPTIPQGTDRCNTHDYPRAIYLPGLVSDDARMGKLEDRQSYVRRVINERFGGKISRFALDFGIDASYAARMLYPKGKAGAKGIGEDTWESLLSRYGRQSAAQPTLRSLESPVEQYDDERAMAIRSLVHSLVRNIPAAGPVFAEHLKKQADEHLPRRLSVAEGFLAEVLSIVGEVPRSLSDDDLRKRPAGFGRKSS